MEKIIFEKVGIRLKQARELRQITLEEAGKKVDVHKSTVLRWENGETEKIKFPVIEVLASFYNVNPVWLMGYDVPMEKNAAKLETNSDYFEFKAEDDAMFPLLDIGDPASVYKQNTFDKDATYLIKLNNKTTIRRIEESKDKEYYELRAMNPLYKTEKLSKKDFSKLEILGKVIKTENYSAFK